MRGQNTTLWFRFGELHPSCPGFGFSILYTCATVIRQNTGISVAAYHANGSSPPRKAPHQSSCLAFRSMPTEPTGWKGNWMLQTLSTPLLNICTHTILSLHSVSSSISSSSPEGLCVVTDWPCSRTSKRSVVWSSPRGFARTTELEIELERRKNTGIPVYPVYSLLYIIDTGVCYTMSSKRTEQLTRRMHSTSLRPEA